MSSSFTGNVKRTSLSRKEEATIREIKCTKGKSLIGKGKYTAKAADKLLMKLVERLKDKVVKLATSATVVRDTENRKV